MERKERQLKTERIRKFLVKNRQLKISFLERQANVKPRTLHNILDLTVKSTSEKNLDKIIPILEINGFEK